MKIETKYTLTVQEAEEKLKDVLADATEVKIVETVHYLINNKDLANANKITLIKLLRDFEYAVHNKTIPQDSSWQDDGTPRVSLFDAKQFVERFFNL